MLLLVESGASLYQQAAQGFEAAFPENEFIRVDLGERRTWGSRLAGAEPRLVVAIGTEAARFARRRWSALPLVYCLALRPRQHGLSGPETGGVAMSADPAGQLAVLRKLAPKAQRIAVVYDLAAGDEVARAKGLRLGFQLVARGAENARQASQLMRELLPQVDAFWLLLDPVVANPGNFRLLVELSLKHQVPVLAPAAPFVEGGALVSVAPNYSQAGRRAAEIAQAIAQGRAQAGAFSEDAPGAVVTINGQVARRLGLAIPPNLQADVLAPEAAP